MRNIKLTIEYDGTDFRGWQVQPGQRTVQGEIEKAVSTITGEHSRVTGAGRTDAGVHAAGQVASVVMNTSHPVKVIRKALNGNLPADIMIRSAEEVQPQFNARYDAYSRTYNYIFILRNTALWRRYFFPATCDLDMEAMKSAASEVIGERDFSSFAKSSNINDTRCRIISCSFFRQSPFLILSVKADRFLYNMVRALAGTLFEIGRGKDHSIPEIIEARDRSAAGSNLPPRALYLMEVKYEPPIV